MEIAVYRSTVQLTVTSAAGASPRDLTAQKVALPATENPLRGQ